MTRVDAREIIAVIVTLGSFGLLGGFIFTGGHLDSGTGVALVAFCSGTLGYVLGFYFGKSNGAQAQLATTALTFSERAIDAASKRRLTDVGPTGATGATGASGAAGAPGPTGPAGAPGQPIGGNP